MNKMKRIVSMFLIFSFLFLILAEYASARDRYHRGYRSYNYDRHERYYGGYHRGYRSLERDLVVLGAAALTLGVINAISQPHYYQPAMCTYESVRMDQRWVKSPCGEWELQNYAVPTRYTAPCR